MLFRSFLVFFNHIFQSLFLTTFLNHFFQSLFQSRTMAILDLERSGRRLISTLKCIHNVIFCCLSMGPEAGADLVRLLGYCGYGMNTDLLRKSLMVDAC